MRRGALLLLVMAPAGLFAKDRIAFIEFFGHQGLDVQAIRSALPFQEGDILRPGMEDEARSTVQRIIGKGATDVQIICCTGTGSRAIFIGLPGSSSHPIPFEAAPQSVIAPPAQLIKLAEELQRVEKEASQRTLEEVDQAVGYRLLNDPTAQAAERAFHEYAAAHEAEILQVLTQSSDAAQRAMAADALGFGTRSPRQLGALVRAARDPDADVRNNVTRALFEILRADRSVAPQIAPDNFIHMLRSETWTDRNKGSTLLLMLTESRDPTVLGRIRTEAGDALLEMAAWRPLSWAMPARILRGRIVGNSDLSAIQGGLPLSLWQGALLAALASALLACVFVRLTFKKISWALGLLTPVAISTLLYWVTLRFVGFSISGLGLLAFLFILPWCLAAAIASCAVVGLRWGMPFRR